MRSGKNVSAAGRLRRRFLVCALAGVVAWGIAAAMAGGARAAAAHCRTIYVAGHERHASIIVDRRDFDPLRSLGAPAFLSKDWLEFGWGDADFYQAKSESLALGLKALLLPTGAVVHVHGFNGSPATNFPKSEVVELRLTAGGYDRLLAFLRASFARGPKGKVKALGPGLYGLSEFYEGTGTYSLFNTCNTWAARALATGGFPVDPDDVGSVTQFMEQVRGKTFAGCPGAGS